MSAEGDVYRTERASDDPLPSRAEYVAPAIEAKWQRTWRDEKTFLAAPAPETRRHKYVLDMFPYPSGDLHAGHGRQFLLGDARARYWRHRGFSVLYPIGWDSFGLPAENAAITRGENPKTWTYRNIAAQRQALRRFGSSFDWTRELHTSDPEYYTWTQWLFTELLNADLAYRKSSWVNWDPVNRTVLANEQVLPDGTSERSGATVEQRQLTQWFLRITDYADRLDDDLEQLTDTWPARVIRMQRNWIGRRSGVRLDLRSQNDDITVPVFTDRAETLAGTTFIAVAAGSDLAAALAAHAGPAVAAQLHRHLAARGRAIAPAGGVPLRISVRHPWTSQPLPVWAADFVRESTGADALLGAPEFDDEAALFAAANGLMHPQRAGADRDLLVDAGVYTGMDRESARTRIVRDLLRGGVAVEANAYRLRDWLVSRQRYWGTPIPVVHQSNGEIRAMAPNDLPVLLPDADEVDFDQPDVPPLATAESWLTGAPGDGALRRDADTLDTFVDSSWYFLRYHAPHDNQQAFNRSLVSSWGPVDEYVGGVEHAVLHLLYARFITKALHDLGHVSFDEPFRSLMNQGTVLNAGVKMSKSKGNGVPLTELMNLHGADAVRVAVAFAGPPEANIDWATVNIDAASRFLRKAWLIADQVRSAPGVALDSADLQLRRLTHRFIADARALTKRQRYNVLVARMMEFASHLKSALATGSPQEPAVREGAESLALVLDVIAPHLAEEMWQKLGHAGGLAHVPWPDPIPGLTEEQSVICVVQVDGRIRARIEVAADIGDEQLYETAFRDHAVARAIGDRPVASVHIVPPRVVAITTIEPRDHEGEP